MKEYGNTTSGLVGNKPLTTSTFDISKVRLCFIRLVIR